MIKNFSQLWRKQNSPRRTMCSFQSVLRVASTNQCSAILPQATAGVFWWIQDVPSLVHQQGKAVHVQYSTVALRTCPSVYGLSCGFLLLVELCHIDFFYYKVKCFETSKIKARWPWTVSLQWHRQFTILVFFFTPILCWESKAWSI